MEELRTLLLGLLRRGELYGYQLRRALEQDQFSPWAGIPAASIYHELE